MVDARFYKKNGPFTLQKLTEVCGGSLQNVKDPQTLIYDIAPLKEAQEGFLSVFYKLAYKEDFLKTQATVCLVPPRLAEEAPAGLQLIVAERPYRAYGQIAALFYPLSPSSSFHSPQACIHPEAQIGKNCTISPFAVIEEGAKIHDDCFIGAHTYIGPFVEVGAHSMIGSHVSLQYTLIGHHVHIKPGARIGQSGFGFDMDEQGHVSIPQVGRVLIGNYVEIGAGTCIDRGSQVDTEIGNHVRIDNLVQIAHNVKIGDASVIVAQVGISGSTQLGKYVIVAGQAGLIDHLKVGDYARIAAQSGVMRDIPAKTDVAGSPAIPARQWHKQTVMLSRLSSPKKPS